MITDTMIGKYPGPGPIHRTAWKVECGDEKNNARAAQVPMNIKPALLMEAPLGRITKNVGCRNRQPTNNDDYSG